MTDEISEVAWVRLKILWILIGAIPLYDLIFNKMVSYVLMQLQYISFLPTYFSFYKSIFRPMLTIGRYIQCVHTLRDSIVFT